MALIGFLGCGKIGKALLKEIKEKQYGTVIFVQDTHADEAEIKELAPEAEVLRSSDEAWYEKADMVIECAVASAVSENLELILKHCNLMMFSVTAFSDQEFERRARRLGEEYGKNIYIPHGAVLGLDGILDGCKAWESISIETIKNPASLGRDDKERTVIYEGTAREACHMYPRNVNVHAAVALAGLGFDKTFSKIVSDPAVSTNTHLIDVKGNGMDVQIRISSFSEGGVTGMYTPLSACGSLKRILDCRDVIKIM